MLIPIKEVRFTQNIAKFSRSEERWRSDHRTVVAFDPNMRLVHIRVKDQGVFSVPVERVLHVELLINPFVSNNAENRLLGANGSEDDGSRVPSSAPVGVHQSEKKKSGR